MPKIVQTIRASFDPERIYLFGSYTAGKPDKHSDLDICIIFRQMTERKIDIIGRIRRAIADIITMPVDLLVYTAAEFNDRATLNASIEHDILEHGMRVYEIEQHGQLDEAAVDGCYTMPRPANEQKFDLRALSEYAKKEGIYPSQLSDEELKRFQK
jgi:predicted nucleotidyltransferase